MAEKKTAAPAAAEVTPEIIEGWKKKYGDVFCVEAEGRKGYLRRPDRRIIASANVIGGVDGLKVKEILLRNCWLGGEMRCLTRTATSWASYPTLTQSSKSSRVT